MIVLIIIIAALLLAVLLFPLTIYVNSAGSQEKIDGVFSISWTMFMFRYRLKDRRTEFLIFERYTVHRSQRKKPLKPEEKKSRKIHPPRDIFNLAMPIMPMLRLFKDLVSTFRLKYFDLDMTFGLRDPAYTGILTGFLHAVAGSLQIGRNIRWTADFTEPVLEWNLKAKAALTPVQILPPVARFIASRQVLRSVGMMFRAR